MPTIKFDDVRMPFWMRNQANQLSDLVTQLSMISSGDIKMYQAQQISHVKLLITQAQNLHHDLIKYGIERYCTEDHLWSTLDKMTVQEVNEKLALIHDKADDPGVALSEVKEIVDNSQPLPTDDFSDEDEEESFW